MLDHAKVLILMMEGLELDTLYLPEAYANPDGVRAMIERWCEHRGFVLKDFGIAQPNLFIFHFASARYAGDEAFASIFTATRH